MCTVCHLQLNICVANKNFQDPCIPSAQSLVTCFSYSYRCSSLLQKQAEKWQLEFDSSKGLHLTISNKHRTIKHSYITVYLITWYRRSLMQRITWSWKNHIHNVCDKANIAQAFSYINYCPTHLLQNYYQTNFGICIPNMGAPPSSGYLCHRKGSMHSVHTEWRSSVTITLNSLNRPSLKSCHTYSKLVMFYKINIDPGFIFIINFIVYIHQWSFATRT